MILGLLAGVLVYCLTIFPVAFLFDIDGDWWALLCMVWAVVCGYVGVGWGMRHS